MNLLYIFLESEVKVIPLSSNLEYKNILFKVDDNQPFAIYNGETLKIPINEIVNIGDIIFMVVEQDRYEYDLIEPMVFGVHGDCNINSIDASICNNKLNIDNTNQPIFVNNKLINSDEIDLEVGDNLVFGNFVLVYGGASIISIGQPLPINQNYNFFPYAEKFEYQTSPRVNKILPDETIEIKTPSDKPKFSKQGIARIVVPPLVSVLGSIALAFITKRGAMIIIGVITTICALTFSIVSYFQERNDIKNKIKFREQSYHKHLLKVRKQLNKAYKSEIDYFTYNYPKQQDVAKMVISNSPRMYERGVSDDDFLTFSVGSHASKPTYKLTYEIDDLKYDKDSLFDEGQQVFDKFNYIPDVPCIIDLKSTNLGLVGNKTLIINELKRIILDLSFFQSYHDLNLVLLVDDQYKSEFDFANWLPHFKIDALNLNTVITSDQQRELVLGSIYNSLRERKTQLEEDNKEIRFNPHIVLLIEDFKLIMNHPIMEYLLETDKLGISLVVCADNNSELMKNVNTIVSLQDVYNAKLELLSGKEKKIRLNRDSLQPYNYEYLARTIAMYDHKVGITNSIPDMVGFLEIFEVDKVEELDIKERWDTANIHKSINVPLGKKTSNEKMFLNLHEKAHGPHGLVAGTTGSGKSEIIQSYILSLAVTFSPYEVGFLLIDFKGGGMANLFTVLPHLIGTITNLDGAESMRALASIKAELKRRQHIFNDHNVNNINLYNQLFKEGRAKEPLPHLFIISDEFAELKKEQPEFMSELISVARIGRTLGVHLILATQKPSGVVDDQIWSNSKFKLALKVQDESDSKEMLKTPDAAHITQTGRAYLQVGNNEIYELFQSAWSGAPYMQNASNEVEIDTNIYEINNLGQRQVINKDLSSKQQDKTVTELDAVINEIKKTYDANNYQPVTKAWLPSLAEQIVEPTEISDHLEALSSVKATVKLGFIDIPDQQAQEEYVINLDNDPNVIIYGSGGYGKSLALGTAIISLGKQNNPQIMNIYALDFGNSGLIGYKNLAHVCDYISFDNVDKLPRLKNKISKLISERKTLLAQHNVTNVKMYEELTNNCIERIVIVIDNYEVINDIDDTFNKFLEIASRDGSSLGITFIVSTNKSGAIKPGAKNNFNHYVSLFMNDSGDMIDAVGRCQYPLTGKTKGRSIVKYNNSIYQMQIYSPISFENDIEYVKKLSTLVDTINNKFDGIKPKGIPDLSDDFNTNDWDQYEYADENKNNIVGLTALNLEKIGIKTFNEMFMVAGPTNSGKTNFIKILLSYHQDAYIIDSLEMNLVTFKDQQYRYVNDNVAFDKFIDVLNKLVDKRSEECQRLIDDGTYLTPREYVKHQEPKYVFIDDYDDFIERFSSEKVIDIFKQAMKFNVKFIIGINTITPKSSSSSMYQVIKPVKDGVVLGVESTYSLLNLPNKEVPQPKYGVLSTNGELFKIRIPQFKE